MLLLPDSCICKLVLFRSSMLYGILVVFGNSMDLGMHRMKTL